MPPEFFTSVVQGVLSSMLGSLGPPQGRPESIAAFLQRLSGAPPSFEHGAGGPAGTKPPPPQNETPTLILRPHKTPPMFPCKDRPMTPQCAPLKTP